MRFNISLNKIAPANIPEAFLVKKSRCDYKHEVDKNKKKGINN